MNFCCFQGIQENYKERGKVFIALGRVVKSYTLLYSTFLTRPLIEAFLTSHINTMLVLRIILPNFLKIILGVYLIQQPL